MSTIDSREAARTLEAALGRRRFMSVATAMGVGAGVIGLSGCGKKTAAAAHPSATPTANLAWTKKLDILQPGKGTISGKHYLQSKTDEVLWGYVPTVHANPVMSIGSGETITIDAVSHEGILEDQGRDPVAFFAEHKVSKDKVLTDAIDIAANYSRTERNFDADGPHVVTGPVAVKGAKPGDVLKIETLEAIPRVPYGVVSSRHGKGALALSKDGSAPAGISLAEVMPPVSTDGRKTGKPAEYGNVSVFTAIEGANGVMDGGKTKVSFPLNPFFGMMGVAYADADGLTDPTANSIPPTLGGGNIDIRLLGVGSTFYLPVNADGALFYVGDPHMAMGNGEVSLTAMEGSVRGTFRLTVCKKGEADAPAIAFDYPFAETEEFWIAIGLSDPDGSKDGQGSDLNIAMRRAVVNALNFLEKERGMDRAVAYAYLSAAADFVVSQFVDRTTGIHAMISKSHFA